MPFQSDGTDTRGSGPECAKVVCGGRNDSSGSRPGLAAQGDERDCKILAKQTRAASEIGCHPSKLHRQERILKEMSLGLRAMGENRNHMKARLTADKTTLTASHGRWKRRNSNSLMTKLNQPFQLICGSIPAQFFIEPRKQKSYITAWAAVWENRKKDKLLLVRRNSKCARVSLFNHPGTRRQFRLPVEVFHRMASMASN